MNDRRKFIARLAQFGITIPFVQKMISEKKLCDQNPQEQDIPILLCSRGEKWGKKVLEPAWENLKKSGDILDSIEIGANVVELDPDDMSVGYGGLPDEAGNVSLDASIMYGPNHSCGSVASLRHIKTPSSVARKVMERSDHIMLVGEGALKFARMHGFKEENLLTDKARLVWLRWKENLSTKDDWLPPADGVYEDLKRKSGTINVLGVDKHGNVAGITTTSGLFGKIPGRVGDSPIIGAGLYVDNQVGAAGATGRGEEVIRTCGSFFVVEQMRQGLSPQAACEAACQRIIDINGGKDKITFNDKFVAVNRSGDVGVASIQGSERRPPRVAYINEDGFHVKDGSYLIDS